MRRAPRSRLALPSKSASPLEAVRGVLRGRDCRYDKGPAYQAGIPLERARLQGRLVGDLAWVWADRGRRAVVRQWRQHQMAGGRSSEMESPARRLRSAAAERT